MFQVKEAKREIVEEVHRSNYLEKLRVDRNLSEAEVNSRENWNSIYLSEHSMDSAYHAAGGLIELTDRICENNLTSGIAIIRPPGHHADEDTTGGFCLLNNVAIAAKYLLYRGMKRYKTVHASLA